MQIIDSKPQRTRGRWLSTGRILILGATLVLVGNSALLYLSLSRLSDATSWVRHTLDARQMMQQAIAELMTAEAAQRAYLIAGDNADLLIYSHATDAALAALGSVEAAVQDNAAQVRRAATIRTLLTRRFEQLETAFAEREQGGVANLQQLLDRSDLGTMTSQIRNAFNGMSAVEDTLLYQRQEQHAQSQINAYISMVVFIGTTLGLIVFAFWFMRRDLRDRLRSQRQIENYAQDLDVSVRALKSERNDIILINEMSNFLQSCNTLDEVAELAGPFFARLFPDHSGAFRAYAESRNQLTLVSSWGSGETHNFILPDDCWSLRRGQTHVYDPVVGGPVCAHCDDQPESSYTICVPLQAFGETLGLLSVMRPAGTVDEGRAEATLRLADLVGRQLGLTLASLRLRQTLNEQSIRDPLTNAFNRRYLEVLATKEIAQADRYARSLAIVMLDIDHFKQFNDVHGHRAGDAALVSVVNFLHKTIREGDWLFRYGGEEFLLMLRDTDADDALCKAEELRAGIEQLSVTANGEALPTVTVSMGISVFPHDAADFAALVTLADEALYAAKRGGRNRVHLASATVTEAANVA